MRRAHQNLLHDFPRKEKEELPKLVQPLLPPEGDTASRGRQHLINLAQWNILSARDGGVDRMALLRSARSALQQVGSVDVGCNTSSADGHADTTSKVQHVWTSGRVLQDVDRGQKELRANLVFTAGNQQHSCLVGKPNTGVR